MNTIIDVRRFNDFSDKEVIQIELPQSRKYIYVSGESDIYRYAQENLWRTERVILSSQFTKTVIPEDIADSNECVYIKELMSCGFFWEFELIRLSA